MVAEITDVKYEEEFIVNSRGMKLFTCKWLPQEGESKAMVFLCHGYAMESSITMKDTGIRLAKAGFAVYGIDYEGHGKSEGLSGLVSSFDNLVDDCATHFTSICEKEENVKKVRLLLGVSMGGAVLLRLESKKSNYWDGGVLVAPMCKIADEMRPRPAVIRFLSMLGRVIPTWKIIPTDQDIVDLAFRDTEVRKEVRANPYCYKGKPRLQTGFQLLNASIELEKRLYEVKLPFLVMHGEDDKVTDPAASKLLYESATSSDKTIKLYPGMWHDLIYGELQENIDIVFSDIIKWLDERTASASSKVIEEQNIANNIQKADCSQKV